MTEPVSNTVMTPIADAVSTARRPPELLKGLRLTIYEVTVTPSTGAASVGSTNLMPAMRITNFAGGNGTVEMREVVDAASSTQQKEYEPGVEDFGKLTLAVEQLQSAAGVTSANVAGLKGKLLQIKAEIQDTYGTRKEIFKQYGYLSGYSSPGTAPAKGKFTGNLEFTLTAINSETVVTA